MPWQRTYWSLQLLLLLLCAMSIATASQGENVVLEEGSRKGQAPSVDSFGPARTANHDDGDDDANRLVSSFQGHQSSRNGKSSSQAFDEEIYGSHKESAFSEPRQEGNEPVTDTSLRFKHDGRLELDSFKQTHEGEEEKEEEEEEEEEEGVSSNRLQKEGSTKEVNTSSSGNFGAIHDDKPPQRNDAKVKEGSLSAPNSLIRQLCNWTGKVTTCYEHGGSRCHCKGYLADCSGKPYRPNIAYAPKLPANIKCLIFRYNHAQYLVDSYFHNVSNFQVIDFSYNDLQVVSKKTFEIFDGNLKYLTLNYNMGLKYKYLKVVLRSAPSMRLDLVNIGLKGTDMPPGFFEPFSSIPTKEFHFDLNFFPELDLRQFSALKNVVFLSFTNSSVASVISAPMPKLNGLDLNNNGISQFPQSCNIRENFTSYFPKLKTLYLNSNNISGLPNSSHICLPSVGLLGLTRNNISSLQSFSLVNLPSLKVLYLDEMQKGITHVGANALSSKTLVELHMSRNKIDFASKSVNPRLFQFCPKLKVLYLSRNNMSAVNPSSFVDLLSIPNLKYLYLGSCGLPVVPTEGLSQLKNLEKLFLYVNVITVIPKSAFDSLTSLQYLYLDQNLIETVEESSFSEATLKRLVKIDLSANNFQCDCRIVWFKQWLTTAGAGQFIKFPDSYACANLPDKLVTDFAISQQACYFSRSTYITFVVCLSIVLTSFIVFTIFFRYRWHIRLALYAWRTRAAYRRLDEEDDVDYQHDVFIVHCNDDQEFVLDVLLDKVENRWGHKALIHERDFQPGRHIFDNIVRAIQVSRCVLVVLTSNFARSRWCNMELKLCQYHVIEHDLPSLLVLQMEPLEVCDMTRMLVAMRTTTTFLEWPANQEPAQVDLFWRRLERCLRELLRGRRRQHHGQGQGQGRGRGQGRGGDGGAAVAAVVEV